LGDALRAAAERSADSAVGGAPLVISTKVGRLLRADAPADPSSIFRGVPQVNPVFDFSADGVRRSLEESLVRLGRDRIDIVYLHDPDDHFEQALGEALPVLRQWRAEGVVGAIGAGMNQSAMLTRFVTDGDIDCVLLAGRYTLLDQTALEDLLPACLAMDVAVVIGGVFNSGVLANPLPGAPYDYIPAPDDVLARASRLAAVCTTFNVPLRAAALQFPLAHPAVACVLAGARSAGEIDDSAKMLDIKIPAALWEALRAEGLLSASAPCPSDPR
ncbi:MAG: aldo/keto reductase, partial [Ilumatobacteraceae bacterium]